MLAAHFITWAYGARMTLTAQASLIVNLAPVAIPFFLHWLLRERINCREILGTGLALSRARSKNTPDRARPETMWPDAKRVNPPAGCPSARNTVTRPASSATATCPPSLVT